MQQRSPALVVAIISAVVVAGLLLFAFATRDVDTGALTGRTWQLAAITGESPAYQGVVPAVEQPRYTIAFATDGTFAGRADCNSIAGTYELSGRDGMTITPGPSTLVACPEGSYGSLFAHALGTVTTWAIADGELTLTTADGGTGTFVEGSGAVVEPSASPLPSPSPTATATPTPSPTASATPTPSPTATPTPSPSATASPSPTPTATPSATPAASGTPKPTAEPTPSPTPKPTAEPTAEPTEEPTPSPTPKPTPTPAPTPAPGADLVGTSWQLVSLTTRDPVSQSVVPVTERSKYTVSFNAGETFSATADCNTVNGRWIATPGGGLTITPGPSTIVACAEGSYGDLYVLALSNSASYAIADGALTITLVDGGTLGYEPVP